MKYLMFICVPEEEVAGDNVEGPDAWVDEMTTRNVRLIGERLRPASTATTVRVRKDEVVVSDGPFAETKEWIGGFDVLECADLDEAIEVASKHPHAKTGAVELRPFWPLS